MDRAESLDTIASLQLHMEELASILRGQILSLPPNELLGYLWTGLIFSSNEELESKDLDQQELFVHALEYVHAVLSCYDSTSTNSTFHENVVSEILLNIEKLNRTAILFCYERSTPIDYGDFGNRTDQVEFMAKSAWLSIRGNRYQVLEEEFFNFVLEPHDDALRCAYGIGAKEIAMGIPNNYK